ncbi:MAG: extracellular solute-binding protein [Phycisphaerales bacterium]|nr:extracellular solute-binding protein [Phycisphaerales bacterium]
MLKSTAALGVAAVAFPSYGQRTGRRKPITLQVTGTHVTLQEQIRLAAEADLGIKIEFSPGGSAAVLQKASTRPESFHVYEQWSNSIPILWQSRAIQPIDTNRIEHWSSINPLSKTGRLTPQSSAGRGDTPNSILYIQNDSTLGSDQSGQVSYLPYVHNVDSFGYDTRVIPAGEAYTEESWSWLLDERWKGKVAVVNEPTIGLFDLALAAQAKGVMEFDDIGDMTLSEIDTLFDYLVELQKTGHFSGVWGSVPESVSFMESGRVVIESMFSPGASALRSRGVPVRYAAPKEGYRAWHGVMCLSSACNEEEADAAYRYMNWWLSGRAGAIMARQGYYISIADKAREYLDTNEWGYWYDGKAAQGPILGTDGRVVATEGQFRNGGSYEERFKRIAVWNTVMTNYEHTLTRWGEFLSTQVSERG